MVDVSGDGPPVVNGAVATTATVVAVPAKTAPLAIADMAIAAAVEGEVDTDADTESEMDEEVLAKKLQVWEGLHIGGSIL